MKLFTSKISGSYYFENACLFTSGDASICHTNFYLLAIEKTTPDIKINGDGFLGLGLDDTNHDATRFNSLD